MLDNCWTMFMLRENPNSLWIERYSNILCLGSAFRYLLTRLYDFSNTPKTALIKIKDPKEYYQKLLAHKQLKTFKDYLD